MFCNRRTFIKSMGVCAGSLLWICQAKNVFSLLEKAQNPLIGINAYYLLVEAYRKVCRNSCKVSENIIEEYIHKDLGIEEICGKTTLNAIRFWAFNDYPSKLPGAVKGALNGRLWLNSTTPDSLAFEVFEALIKVLDKTGLRLIPVLSNYWLSYGGILQYLVWSGKLSEREYRKTVCNRQAEEQIYLYRGMEFFVSRQVETCFRKHISKVLRILAGIKNLFIIDIMNEPRGKSYKSIKNEPWKDKTMCSDIMVHWLNSQARWTKEQLEKYGSKGCLISSGEEGWSGKPLCGNYRYLKKDSQYYEGIDCEKNLATGNRCLDCGSIHLYFHRKVSLLRRNICGVLTVDQRGWDYLLKDGISPTPSNYQRLAEEWIISRGRMFKNKPWYIGEMGWSWPKSSKNPAPVSSAKLLKTRVNLYKSWHNLALQNGAIGSCIWMLEGLEHKDEFYGLNKRELIEILKA